MGDNYPIVIGPPRGPQAASDEIGGVHYPRVKLSFGANGACGDVCAANPLPVAIISGGGSSSGGLTNDELRATPLPISGTVSVGTVAVTGGFYPVTQPVSGTVSVSGSVAVTGTFFQATQPVSGAFFQATQPVSIAATVAVSAASLPLPAGASTETTLAAVNTKTPSLGQTTMAASSPVVIASNQSAVPVSGTFWQSTQPVSIASMPSTPVTGTFWQATQPVSGTVAANINGTVPVSGAFFQSTQPVSLASLPTTPAGTNLIGRVQPLYAARVVRNFVLDSFTAAPVADALQSVVQWYNNAAVGATTQPAVVPAGKILRLTSWGIETKSLATVGSVVVRVRANTSGTVVIGSPLAGSFSAGSIAGATTTAMTGAFCSLTGDFGEGGLEFAAGTGIGFSMAGYGPTGTLTLEGVTRFWVYGYEYTA